MRDTSATEDRLSAVAELIGSRIWLRRHGAAFLSVTVVLLAINAWLGGGWWSFWPTYAWGLVIAVHFFYVRAVNVSDDWVQERTEDLHMRSYDFDHIRDINRRVSEDDFSVKPSDKRGA